MGEPKRDGYGRYLLPGPDGDNERPWTRATTLSGALKDTYALDKWNKRMVVLGIAARPDLYDLACASDPEDKKQLDDLCEDALKAAKAGIRANQGTSLHKFTQRLDEGHESRAPARWEKDIDAYLELKQRYGILTHPRMCERVTIVPALGVAGTMDRIVKHKGEAKIGDVKTGTTVEYSGMEIAMQLAIYSRGIGLWNDKIGEWDQMPAVSQVEGLVFHIPVGEGRATLYSVDLDFGWKVAQTAKLVREWRKDKDILAPYPERP